jgi:hypothetical protein
MRPYDDSRYLQWVEELRKLIAEYLDTEGNTQESLDDEIENAIENEVLNARED